jgi:hypothetical protein
MVSTESKFRRGHCGWATRWEMTRQTKTELSARARQIRIGLFACLLLWVAVPHRLLSQSGAGTIEGTVKDASGAVIAGSTVAITHSDTARTYETKTNEAGFFIFPAIQPGSYRIVASAPGMKTWEATALLRVGQSATISPELAVGSTLTEIRVLGDAAPLVTTDVPTTGNVLERTRIEQLPLNGRFLQNIIANTTPGVDSGSSNPTVYGIRYGMQFVQDGAVLSAAYFGGIWNRPPGMDTVQEFKVETSISGAKFASPATSILSTRAGTNGLHGSLFETARNNGFGVARAREDSYVKAPQLIRNEFGASAGGPVILPKIYNGKNKTFFFFAWEAYRYAYAQTALTSVHTTAQRNGDFSDLVAANGRQYTLYDPRSTGAAPTYTRTPFVNNQIPVSLESPMAKYLLSVTPQPTMPNVNPLVGNNYSGLVPLGTSNNTETVRIDQRLSDRNQLFARYTHGGVLTRGLRSTLPTTDGLLNTSRLPVQDNGGAINLTHTFSPTLFSETSVAVSQEDYSVAKGSTGAGSLIGKLGVPNPYNDPLAAIVVRKTGYGMDYREQETELSLNRTVKVDQNFTKILGRHELQFGGRYNHERYNVLAARPRLTTSFQNSYATSLLDTASGSAYNPVSYTGNDAANFFLGIANSYDTTLMRSWYRMSGQTLVGYVQDNLKVSPRFTLNAGIRWEYYPGFKEDNNLLNGFDISQKAIVTGTPLSELYKMGATTESAVKAFQDIGVKFLSAKDVNLPSSLIRSNKWDFNPRVGFAYRLGGTHRTTVLRGGYGLFGFAPNIRVFTDNMRRDVPMYALRQYYANASQFASDGLPNSNLRSAPGIIAGTNSSGVLAKDMTGDTLRGTFQYTFFDPDQPTMRAHEWNFTAEHEVAQNIVLRAGYVGTHGGNLEQYRDLNTAPNAYVWYSRTGKAIPTGTYAATAMNPFDNTTYGTLWQYGRTGWSNANSVRLEAERRYSRGIAFQFYYVMTNALKSRGSDVNQDFVYPVEDYLPNAVPTDFNARNRFLNYRRDTDVSKHRLSWNWMADLPFGKDKKLFGNAGGVLNRVIGGWQVGGLGSFHSNYFALPATYAGPTSPVQVYGRKYPIQDCRSGVCYAGYLWYNGYIPPNRINSYSATGKPNGVMGVPSDYTPVTQPVNNDPTGANYGTDTVKMTLNDGSTVTATKDTNLNPLRNQFVGGPWTFSLDASVFKNIPVTERVVVRFTADAFNVLNAPGLVQPGPDGIASKQTSANTPRQLQLSLRLTW